jgi:hypothetical protein
MLSFSHAGAAHPSSNPEAKTRFCAKAALSSTAQDENITT